MPNVKWSVVASEDCLVIIVPKIAGYAIGTMLSSGVPMKYAPESGACMIHKLGDEIFKQARDDDGIHRP